MRRCPQNAAVAHGPRAAAGSLDSQLPSQQMWSTLNGAGHLSLGHVTHEAGDTCLETQTAVPSP